MKDRIKIIIFAAVTALLAAVDQYTKYLAAAGLKNRPAFRIIDGVLELTYLQNRGAAWGMLEGRQGFFAVRQPRWHLAVLRCRGVSWGQRAPSEAETGE